MPSQYIRVALTFLTFHMFQMLPLPLPLGTELMVRPGLPVAISGVGGRNILDFFQFTN